MEKIDITTFPKYEGDFIKLPSTFRILGFSQIACKGKNGQSNNASVLVCKREDGEEITLFADQLRKEGDALFVSESHLKAQVARQEAYRAQRARPKQ